LLPALAAILKTRKRKLASQMNSNSQILSSTTNVNSATESTNSLIITLSNKINSFDNNTAQNINLNTALNSISLQIEASKRLNISILSQAQLSTLFF